MATITAKKVEDFYTGKKDIVLDETAFDAILGYVNAQERNVLRLMRDVDSYSQFSEMVHESNTHDVFRALINEEREKFDIPHEDFVVWVRHNLRTIQQSAYILWTLWHLGRPANTVPAQLKAITVAMLEGQQDCLRSKQVEVEQD